MYDFILLFFHCEYWEVWVLTITSVIGGHSLVGRWIQWLFLFSSGQVALQRHQSGIYQVIGFLLYFFTIVWGCLYSLSFLSFVALLLQYLFHTRKCYDLQNLILREFKMQSIDSSSCQIEISSYIKKKKRFVFQNQFLTYVVFLLRRWNWNSRSPACGWWSRAVVCAR